jgi:hypothetical protein
MSNVLRETEGWAVTYFQIVQVWQSDGGDYEVHGFPEVWGRESQHMNNNFREKVASSLTRMLW